MNKDVIYIDVEDDVTAIIGKVKDSKEKVVALVPPKRTGVLQSAVNLRILQRTAKTAGKHIVLITNDQSLIPLAAGASIPVAKNLQSKPEIPEIAALKIDDDDDIIDGSQLPVGEHAATAVAPSKRIPVSSLADDKKPYAAPPKAGESPRKSKAAGKVPNFNSFRKKLILIIAGVILLIGFLVWAIFFAPRATVEITAKTSKENLSTSVTLGSALTTDATRGTLKTTQVEEPQQASVDFQATGTQEQGESATGTITVTKTAINNRSITIPVGTGFSNGDYTFTTTKQIVLGRTEIGGSGVEQPSQDVPVKATKIGEEYNLSARTYQSTVADVSAKGGDMTGGSKKTLKIVTQADVQKASEQLAQQNSDEIKTKLIAKFDKGTTAIDTSFRTIKADTVSSPQVGQEAASGTAKLTSSVTYTMSGVTTNDLDDFIEAAIKSKLSKETDQRVYETGAAGAKLTDFAATDTGGTASLAATAQVGPQINDNDVKKRVAGKKFGDIQSDLKSIDGVNNVEVKFWPFWVSTVPSDTQKISIKFNLDEN